MNGILRNPITLWLVWFIKSRYQLLLYRGRHLSLGYMSRLSNVKVGLYDTFHQEVSISDSVVGNFVYVSNNSNISRCQIGSFCSIGPNVKIGMGIHPTDHISTSPIFYSTKRQCQITFVDKDLIEEHGRIKIGNDVWIGANVIIMDNVEVGDGAIIAAGAVVNRDVQPYSIVGGVPAKVIRMRFGDVEIKQLLQIKWWNRDIDWIRKNASLFATPLLFFADLKFEEQNELDK